MENKALSFDTGLVTYDINGKVKVTFNPTDSAFVERLFKTFSELDAKQEQYKAEAQRATEREVFAIAQKRDAEMREMLDGVFGASVCSALFGDMNLYALADGLPVWANFLLVIMDEIDTTFAREEKQTNVRIRKYSEKYKRR